MTVFLLSEKVAFPPPHLAEKEGLLAIGGDLSEERILLAYSMGIFPWYSEGEPILWWSPDPRLVLFPSELIVSRSLHKTIRKNLFRITLDTAFEKVVEACARTRTEKGQGTWLVDEMIDAYCRLNRSGYAHSVEAWHGSKLAGGLYGVALGGCFFGESMFSAESNASKVAFVQLISILQDAAFTLVDCQVSTAHLVRFGAREVTRKKFLGLLSAALKKPTIRGSWSEM